VLKVSHRYLTHSGGTKDYDLLVIENPGNDRAVLVQRWGRKDTPGQRKTSTGPTEQIRREFWTISKSKERRGYREDAPPTFDERISSAADLRAVERAFARINLVLDNKTKDFLMAVDQGTQFAKPTTPPLKGEPDDMPFGADVGQEVEAWGTW